MLEQSVSRIHRLVKSLLLYLLQNCFMCTSVQNHQAYKAGSSLKSALIFPYRNGKIEDREKTIACTTTWPQELTGSVAAAGIDLVPLVEGGGGRLEHDVELLFEA